MLLLNNEYYSGRVDFVHLPTSHSALHKTRLSLGSMHQLAIKTTTTKEQLKIVVDILLNYINGITLYSVCMHY